MAIYRVEIPVTLELEVSASDAQTALRHVDTAFAHAKPLDGLVVINLILRRGEKGRAELKDARPIGDAALAVDETASDEEAAQ